MVTTSAGGLGRLRRAVSSRLPRGRSGPEQPPAAAEEAPANPPLPDDPLLSVVVPVYDVEAYLEECLDSILGQDYGNLEVLIVDDGSPDGSADIARRYVERDDRCRLITQANAGLGAARNAGIEAATGDLLAFCDSDDYVLPGAYRTLVSTLVGSGSDFVVGCYRRDEPDEGIRPWMKQAHAVRRIGVRLEDATEILPNVFAWTKVFRRDFVDRLGLRFPHGVRYEDQVPMTHAYLMARAFDVVPDPVYLWRRRSDGSSITQQKGQAADLHDRLAAKRRIAELMDTEASEAVALGWYVKVFRIDLFTYFRVSGDQDEDYWAELSSSTRTLLDEAPAELFDHVEVRFRVAAWLAARRERAALDTLLAFEELNSSNFAVRSRDGELYADLDFVAESGVTLPDELLRLRACDLLLRPHLVGLDWTRPGRLGVRVLAVVRHVDPRLHPVRTSLALTSVRGTERLEVPCTVDPDPEGNVAANRHHEDHTDSTLVGEVDLAALVRASGTAPRTRWVVGVAADALGHTREAPFDERRETGSAALARSMLIDDALVVAEWSDRRGLMLEVRRRFVALERARWTDGCLRLDLRVAPGTEVHGVLVAGEPVHATWDDADLATGRLRLNLPVTEIADRDLVGRIRVDCGWAHAAPVMLTGAIGHVAGPPADCPLALEPHVEGMVRLVPAEPTLLVDDVRFGPDSVTVSGEAVGVKGFAAYLRGPRASTPEVDVTVEGGRFEAVVRTRFLSWGGREALLPANGYAFAARAAGEDVRVRARALTDEPRPRAVTHRWTAEVGERRTLTLRLGRQEHPETVAGIVQQRLVDGPYAAALAAPRRPMLVFESYGGTAAGDTPRAVCDLLRARGTDLDLVWSVNDPAVAVPDGTRSVVRHTPEWYDALGSASHLVNNTNFPPRFRKAPGQVYVQTWHGTPLKRIGGDIPDQQHFSDSYLRLMEREAAAWDYLVSPSPFCTEVLPRALGYDGPVLEIGYPRNDLLRSPDADAVRRTLRAELGIPEDHTVLLYAPTWREDARAATGYEKVLHLDADAVVAARPDVTVLVRGHSNVAGKAAVGDGRRVLDVTGYPDPAGLYLAADVLVTDYSSVFFDFALTDKPMLFLVPDLEGYRDGLRGFYLDLAEIAPGPLLRSTEEVLGHLDEDPARYAEARARLRERFAPHDDGHASERLVQAVLGQG